MRLLLISVSLQALHSGEPGYLVWHLLWPFIGVAPASSGGGDSSEKHLLEAAAGSVYLVKSKGETSAVTEQSQSTLANLAIDGKGFLQATSMSGTS